MSSSTLLGLASPAASRIIDNTVCTALPKTPPPRSCAPHTQLQDDADQALTKEERLIGSERSCQSDIFQRERDLLLCDIAESLEELLNHTNALNRNLEELLRVRHFIDEGSALYDAFARIMTELVRIDWRDQANVGASHGL